MNNIIFSTPNKKKDIHIFVEPPFEFSFY